MNPKYKLMLAVLAGVALGATVMQGLHAQVKPKAYTVSELETIDADQIADIMAGKPPRPPRPTSAPPAGTPGTTIAPETAPTTTPA